MLNAGSGRDFNIAAIAAAIGDRDTDRIASRASESFGPFDGDHTLRREILIEANLVEVRSIQSIEIDVDQW